MTDVWLGIALSASLIGTGFFLLNRDPSKLSGRGSSASDVRQGGNLCIVLGAVMAAATVYIFVRGAK